VMSAISPPVMVGVFAASSIANSDPMKTAWHSLRLSVVGFAVPFIFIYDPRVLMLGGVTFEGCYLLFSTVVGIIALAVGFERFAFFQRLDKIKTGLFLIVAVIIMLPSLVMSTIGLVSFAVL